ncbi:hypothetical protein JOM56_007049 [Amanita muscaria]
MTVVDFPVLCFIASSLIRSPSTVTRRPLGLAKAMLKYLSWSLSATVVIESERTKYVQCSKNESPGWNCFISLGDTVRMKDTTHPTTNICDHFERCCRFPEPCRFAGAVKSLNDPSNCDRCRQPSTKLGICQRSVRFSCNFLHRRRSVQVFIDFKTRAKISVVAGASAASEECETEGKIL